MTEMTPEIPVPLGPRLVMTHIESGDNPVSVYFDTAHSGVPNDGYFMSRERWEDLGRPSEIEIRLEVNS